MRYSIVGADGGQYGPVDEDQLVNWARQGRVIERTEILDHDTGRRFQANDLPQLNAYFSKPLDLRTPSAPPQIVTPVHPPAVIDHQGQLFIPAYRSVSHRNRVVAGLLALFFGVFGVHRFYLGYTGIGILQLLLATVLIPATCGMSLVFVGIWAMIEAIMCFVGGLPDAEGRPLS